MERGIELFNTYKETYGLKMWIQQNDRDTVLAEFYHPPIQNTPKKEDDAAYFLPIQNEDNTSVRTDLISLDELDTVFASDSIDVRMIKDIHTKLESTSKKKKNKPEIEAV